MLKFLEHPVNAIKNKRQARCSLDLALHVLEVMEGILNSSTQKEIYHLNTKPPQPKYLSEDEIRKLKN